MKLADFHYDLPPGCIAQEPAPHREDARLFVHERGADATRHRIVRELGAELVAGDLLVMNDTRVLPARLHGRRASGGAVELLLLPVPSSSPGRGRWRAMVRPARKLRPGEELTVEPRAEGDAETGPLVVRMGERETGPDGHGGPFWTLELFDPHAPDTPVEGLLQRAGRMPLPPYIERATAADPRDASDRERYQTVFARAPGSVAAPTAGLHLTGELLAGLFRRGVESATLTLHVGPGTFLPVTVDDPAEHPMHAEHFTLPRATVQAVGRCRERGGRVVAVGTTSARVLESCAAPDGTLAAAEGETDLFLRPGSQFRVVDALLTNFHLPRSTLLMLVAALVGRERILRLYGEAHELGYRFYSYGDAMLLLP